MTTQATPARLILMSVSVLLGNLLRGALTSLGDIQVVSEANPLDYQGEEPHLVLVEVTSETETWVHHLVERGGDAPLVLIGPLGDSEQLRGPRESVPPREIHELSADVSIAEIVRVCRELLGGRPPEHAPSVRSLPSNPFDFEMIPRDSVVGLPSLQAPLFPVSAPPSSHPSKRPSSAAPAGQGDGDLGAFELDPELGALLAETEARVASELSPRLTSPPDVIEDAARSERFFVSPEVRSALEEPIERFHEKNAQREHSQLSGTPNSNWATRTGIGPNGSKAELLSSVAYDAGRTGVPTGTLGSIPRNRTVDAVDERPAVSPGPPSEVSEPAPSAPSDGATTRPPPPAISRKALMVPAVPPPPALPHDHWPDPEPNTPAEVVSLSPPTDGAPAHFPQDSRPTQQPPQRGAFAPDGPQFPGPTAPSVVHDTAKPTALQEPPPEHPLVTPRRVSELPPLTEGDTVGLFARAIRTRYTGTVVIEAHGGIRRVVLRDGDFVTAASGLPNESLLAFLITQGTLGHHVAQRLERRLPSFGRHAGAALIAAGHLTQEQLWPCLRAHAEYIIGEVLKLDTGVAGFEEQIAERLANEPAVFGGATGAEVFVELVKRVVPPQVAVQRLGGIHTRLTEGQAFSLLDECALTRADLDAVHRGIHSGHTTLSEVLGVAHDAGFPSTIYALCQLRVLRPQLSEKAAPEVVDDAYLDERALREAVAARLALVEDGDYFKILGLTPDATAYDIRRAYVELKRTFHAGRAADPAIADLREDIELIATVLDEAYDILHDHTRRERYRRALLSVPQPNRDASY
jgi:hypothetical protein